MEIWKDVRGFEGVYQVSNMGRLKSFKQNNQGRVLSVKNGKGAYLNFVLCCKHKRKSVKLHRLIAEHFLPNPHNKPQVHHIDGNKQNNKLENLKWVTEKENMRHAIEDDPSFLRGMVLYNTVIRPKKIEQITEDGKTIRVYRNAKDAARATGVCGRNILQVANQTEYKPGKTRKQAGGYIWRFAECSK